jgi:hypothetical protein
LQIAPAEFGGRVPIPDKASPTHPPIRVPQRAHRFRRSASWHPLADDRHCGDKLETNAG